MSQVHRLWWLSEASLAMLGAHLDNAAAAWSQAWGLPGPPPGELRKAQPGELDVVAQACADESWRAVGPLAPGLARGLEQALFGSDTGAGLAAETSQLALAALVRVLGEVVGHVPVPVPGWRPLLGDAGAVYTLQIGQDTVVVTVPVAWWLNEERRDAERASQPPRLTDWQPRVVLADVPVTVEVPLGQTELTVGELALLEPGDVVLLDQAIHLPLSVRAADADVRLHAFLGQHEGRRSVQLASAPAEKKT